MGCVINVDVVVIGAGVAGLSAAAGISQSAEVLVLERESQSGYHSSGRSAAYFAPAYGNEVVQLLTKLSTEDYLHPASYFDDQLLTPRASLFVARADQRQAAERMQAAQPRLAKLDRDAMRRRVPPLKEHCEHGLFDAEGGDLNVHAILQGYRRQLRQNGADLRVDAEVIAVTSLGQGWEVACANGLTVRATKVVNAAGAWADAIGQLAGLSPLGLIPKRRTACLVQPQADWNVDEWPMVINIDEEVYFKSEAGRLMVSPADETDTVPCDAQPEVIDVAIAIDRYQQIIDHPDAAPTHTWAGLRTFAPDRTFVVGPDPRLADFYWLAGQGGYGVQSAPAMARLAAQMVLDQPIDKAARPIVQRVRPNRLIEGDS